MIALTLALVVALAAALVAIVVLRRDLRDARNELEYVISGERPY